MLSLLLWMRRHPSKQWKSQQPWQEIPLSFNGFLIAVPAVLPQFLANWRIIAIFWWAFSQQSCTEKPKWGRVQLHEKLGRGRCSGFTWDQNTNVQGYKIRTMACSHDDMAHYGRCLVFFSQAYAFSSWKHSRRQNYDRKLSRTRTWLTRLQS